MKIRIAPVTNSSSASFTILKENITHAQASMIYNHIQEAEERYKKDPITYKKLGWINKDDSWDIHEDESTIHGFTSMDNFNMSWFLKNVVGIDENLIKFDYS